MGAKRKDIRRRICAGEVCKRDVNRRLAEMAFGKVNDCVKLALQEDVDLDALDLSLLSEVRRSDKGMVEIKLIDRLKVLEQLAQAVESGGTEMASFFQAMQDGENV